MRLGFTGTRDGLTEKQYNTLVRCIRAREGETINSDFFFSGKPRMWDTLLHGDCIGADLEAHNIAVVARIPINVYPPTDNKHRVFCDGEWTAQPQSYLDRNKAIVNRSDALIACPKGPEELRSGTWSTVRYARKQKKTVYIIYPDGRIE